MDRPAVTSIAGGGGGRFENVENNPMHSTRPLVIPDRNVDKINRLGFGLR